MNIFDKARYEGVSMSELGRRGGKKAGRRRQKKTRLEKEYEAIKERGDDWWNR